MNNKIINPNRYKKVTKTGYNRNRKNKNYKVKSKSNKHKINLNIDFAKVGILVGCIFLLVIVYYLSNYMSNLNYDKYLTVFNDDGEKITVDLDYNFKVGVMNLNSYNNILTNEINNNVYRKLLSYDEDYKIEYDLLESIVKLSPLKYNLKLKDDKYLNEVLNYLKEKGYEVLNNDLNIAVILKEENEYFPYYLNENIVKEGNYEIDVYTEDKVSYSFKDNLFESSLKNISVINYTSSYKLIEDFKNSEIDSFLTSSDQDLRLIGKYEYNSKKYRNGETIFLMFNKDKELLKDLDMRKVITQSINRDEIVKNISGKFTEVIDIPYINSKLNYKYDVYGSENILVNKEYVKKDGIYYKDGKMLSLDLAVNKEDSIKVNIADIIKSNFERIGIRVNIVYEKNDNYDLALYTVNLNNNPDILYLEEYINISKNINNKIIEVKSSSINDLSNNIINLQDMLYTEYSCVRNTC